MLRPMKGMANRYASESTMKDTQGIKIMKKWRDLSLYPRQWGSFKSFAFFMVKSPCC